MFFMWSNVQFTRKFITSWTYSSWWQTIPLSVSYYFVITSNDPDPKWPQMIRDDPKWPYYLRFCNKAFIQRTDVLAHERVHTGEKPFGKSKSSSILDGWKCNIFEKDSNGKFQHVNIVENVSHVVQQWKNMKRVSAELESPLKKIEN